MNKILIEGNDARLELSNLIELDQNDANKDYPIGNFGRSVKGRVMVLVEYFKDNGQRVIGNLDFSLGEASCFDEDTLKALLDKQPVKIIIGYDEVIKDEQGGIEKVSGR